MNAEHRSAWRATHVRLRSTPVRFRRLSMMCMAMLLAGCATQRDVARESVKFNKALALSSNRILLLNIVRASKNMPLVYSRLGSERNEIQGTIGSELNIPIGNIGDSAHVLDLSAGWEGTRTINLDSFVDEKFLKAARAPITPDMFLLYWSGDFPREAVLDTFVSEYQCENNKNFRYYDESKRGTFEKITQKLADDSVSIKEYKEESTKIIWDFSVAPVKMTWKDFREAIETYEWRDGKLVKINKKTPTDQLSTPESNLGTMQVHSAPEVAESTNKGIIISDVTGCTKVLKMTLRSPESMVYYLGSLIGKNADTKYFNIQVSNLLDPVPLFESTSLPMVRFKNKRYWFKRSEAGDGSVKLTLVDQVFGQLQERSEAPKANIIEVSN